MDQLAGVSNRLGELINSLKNPASLGLGQINTQFSSLAFSINFVYWALLQFPNLILPAVCNYLYVDKKKRTECGSRQKG